MHSGASYEAAAAQCLSRFVSRECSPPRSDALLLNAGVVNIVCLLMLPAAIRTVIVNVKDVRRRVAN